MTNLRHRLKQIAPLPLAGLDFFYQRSYWIFSRPASQLRRLFHLLFRIACFIGRFQNNVPGDSGRQRVRIRIGER